MFVCFSHLIQTQNKNKSAQVCQSHDRPWASSFPYMCSCACTNSLWDAFTMLFNIHNHPWAGVAWWLLCNCLSDGTVCLLVFFRSTKTTVKNQTASSRPSPLLSKHPSATSQLAHALLKTSRLSSPLATKELLLHSDGGNDDHGSLSSPWRMDPIHSVLACAY